LGKKVKILFSARADKNLQDIYDYIAGGNAAKADELKNNILKSVERLLTFPDLGRNKESVLLGKYKKLVGGKYLIYYSVSKNGIYIHSVKHGAAIKEYN
jgi:plasmid stabilization system protein ParE